MRRHAVDVFHQRHRLRKDTRVHALQEGSRTGVNRYQIGAMDKTVAEGLGRAEGASDLKLSGYFSEDSAGLVRRRFVG